MSDPPDAETPAVAPDSTEPHVACTVLARAPEPGRVKTRLAASIGDAPAAALHEAMTLDVLDALAAWLERLPAVEPSRLVLALTGDLERASSFFDRVAELDARHEVQPDGDLGVRIGTALERRHAEGFAASLVVGTDAPTLSSTILSQAASALARADVALAPARDGGYVLIGARSLGPPALEGIPWGGERVLESTRRRLDDLGLVVELVEGGEDVDDLAGLLRLHERLERAEAAAPRSRRWLADHQQLLAGPADEPPR